MLVVKYSVPNSFFDVSFTFISETGFPLPSYTKPLTVPRPFRMTFKSSSWLLKVIEPETFPLSLPACSSAIIVNGEIGM